MAKQEKKLLLGAHMSISGGVFNAIGHGVNTGCTSIQIFTKNNNQWRAKPLADDEIEKFLTAQKEAGIAPVVAHTAYLINLGSPNEDVYQKSLTGLIDEIERADQLKIADLVLHPGSPLDQGEEYGMKKIINSLNHCIDKTPDAKTRISLECTAGQGAHLGFKFEQIAEMIDGVEDKNRVSVCVDTCHIFAAGYDIRTKDAYETTIATFKKIIGLRYLKVIHLNDSLKGLGSRVDRHTHIGQGEIGKDAFKFIMQDARLDGIPKLLETPKDGEEYEADKKNLAILRKFWNERE
ncbi:MAG: deoxyribonuclease IV [Candidatus Zixiibacteriota bacterium]|nr:MAG: deoxyribonuclease IV [candidate division Zixibacteria bacterium]